MNKRKLIIIVSISALIVILGLVLFLTRRSKDADLFFEGSEYPVTVQLSGADLKITLDGGKTPDLAWTVEVEDPEVVKAELSGKEKKGRATFLVSPLTEGYTELRFTRSGETGGVSMTAVVITFSISAGTNEDGRLEAFIEEEPLISGQSEAGGTDTDFPFILENSYRENASILFPKGESDWYIRDPNGLVGTMILADAGEQTRMLVYPMSAGSEGADGETAATESASAGAASTESASAGEGDGEYFREEMVVGNNGAVSYEKKKIVTEEATSQSAEEGPDEFDKCMELYSGTLVTDEDGTRHTTLLAYRFGDGRKEFIDVAISAGGVMTLSMGQEPTK